MTEEEFDNHPLWAEIEACQEVLPRTEVNSSVDSGPDRERIRWIAAQVKKFKSSEWRFFSAAMLQSVYVPWNQAHATLDQVERGSTGSWPTAREQVEQCLAPLASWPLPGARRGGRGKAEQKFFDEYEKSVGAALVTTKMRIEELTAEAAQQNEDHATAMTEMEQRIAALTTAVEEQTERISTASASLDAKTASIETEAAGAQTARGEKFDDWLGATETKWVNEKAQPIVDEIQATNEVASTRLTELEDLGTQIEKVAGKIASAVLARDYGRYSTREWVTGLVAYGLGIGLLIGVGIYLLLTVGDVERDSEVSWQYITLKIGLTVTVVAASTVLFQVGRQALRQANDNKKTELELRAIGPFLADVDDESAARDAKIAFIQRSFGRSHHDQGKNGSEVVSVSLIENLVKLLTR